jgi:muramoyltetrapeptide carboxypeptidase
MRLPPLLKPGSRVALVAPAGPLRGEADVVRAAETVRSLGWEPVVGDHVLDRVWYLAGTDTHRLADFNRFAADDAIDGIWCLRGGYGAMRILDQLDYGAFRRRPKALIGYSDVTAIHQAIRARCNLGTYHGPMARLELSELGRASLRAAVIDGTNPCGVAPDAVTVRSGRARGRLVGGNLALVAGMSNTSFAAPLDDGILVLEDVNESVYRLDRLFTQLRLSGALDNLAGIAFGQFTDIPPDTVNEERPLGDLLQEVADRCSVPCLAGIPLGHVADQWTFPLGAMAELDADAKSIVVER